MVFENDRNHENVGRYCECHHRNIEDDQQVISFAVKLVVKIPKYIPGDVHSEAFVWRHHRPIVRAIKLWWRYPWVVVYIRRHDFLVFIIQYQTLSYDLVRAMKRKRKWFLASMGIENISHLPRTEKTVTINRVIIIWGSCNLNYAITRGTVSVTQIINEEIFCTRIFDSCFVRAMRFDDTCVLWRI